MDINKIIDKDFHRVAKQAYLEGDNYSECVIEFKYLMEKELEGLMKDLMEELEGDFYEWYQEEASLVDD